MDEHELRRLLTMEPSDYVVRALAGEVRRLTHLAADLKAELARVRREEDQWQKRTALRR